MKRRPRERSLSREDVAVKRIVRHKSHNEICSQIACNRGTSPRKHLGRYRRTVCSPITAHNQSSHGSSGGGGASFQQMSS